MVFRQRGRQNGGGQLDSIDVTRGDAIAGGAGRPSLRDRLNLQRDSPLVRSGAHLITSAGVTSVLGLAYWSLAARRYSPAAVGATAGLLASMELIAAVANLGLRTALIRFVPSLGDRVGRVVAVSYAVTGTIALVAAALFVAVHGRFFPELTLLDQSPGAAFFLVSTVLWVLFILQDSVLIGLRRSSWLPVENALFASAKLALLVALTTSMPQWGIYVSWSAPLLVVVVAVNIPIFTWLRRGATGSGEEVTLRDLVRFSAGDYAASTVWLLTIDGLPLLVLALAGARANAWYSLAWTVAYTLYLIPSAVGSALVAESAHDAHQLEANTRRAFTMSLVLVVPAALVVALGAPVILSIFGSQYAADASPLLRLMALSSIPYVVSILYVNVERAQRRIAAVVRLYAVACTGLLVGSAVMVPVFGVTATGVSWLAVQMAVAAWVLVVPMRDVWVRALPTPMIRWIGAPAGRLADRRCRREAAAIIPGLLRVARPDTTSWSLLHVTTDVAIARLSPPTGPELVLKLPRTHEAELSRRREMATLVALRGDPRTKRWAVAAPALVDHGTVGPQAWSVETMLHGLAGGPALEGGMSPDRLLAGAGELLLGLHRATGELTTVDDRLLRMWVDEPAALVVAACPDAAPGLADLTRTLHRVLAGRAVTVALTHGDVSPANLVVERSGRVAGLVDWEIARSERLPELDLVGLIAGLRAQLRTEEFGEVVLALLQRPWNEDEIAVLDRGPNSHLPRPALVLLAWLHHVAANLGKSGQYEANRVWIARNVLTVADALAMPTEATPAPVPTGAPALGEELVNAPARGTVDRRVPSGPQGPTDPDDPSSPSRVPASATSALAPDRPRDHRWRRHTALAAWAVPPVAVLMWFAGVAGVDPRSLTDTGLVSGIRPVGYLAVATLALGFALALARRPFPEGLVATHVGALAVVLFATPAVIYPTVRYSWAWKHMGIVDFIGRHGAVDPGIEVLPIYHNWPGFFAGSHLLQTWMGADDVTVVARWAPLVVTLATVGGVCLLAGTFTTDRRVVWLTAWIFLLGDWVGQEYFSPQALSYLLYLVAVSLAVRVSRARGTRAPRSGSPDLTVLVVILLTIAIATSHQITPAMLCVALIALTVSRRAHLLVVSLVAVVVTVTWALWGAADFVVANVKMVLEGFGSPMANAEGSLVDAGKVSGGQALVALAGRGVVAVIALLAAVGMARAWRRDREATMTMAVLGAAPLVILATNEFGGEILFRVYLFALPVAAWFGAQAILDIPRMRGRLAAVAPLVVSLVLLPGFLLAHFGKDGHYVFTHQELAAAEWLDDHAPPGSLLIQGSSNYPVQFRNYEYFRYVPLDTETLASREGIARHPVGTMVRWMSDPDDTDAYLLITRSQEREAEAMGYRPDHFLEDMEDRLMASGRFDVAYRNRDAVVLTLAGRDS